MSKITFEISDKKEGRVNIKMTIQPPPKKKAKMTTAEQLGMEIHEFINKTKKDN